MGFRVSDSGDIVVVSDLGAVREVLILVLPMSCLCPISTLVYLSHWYSYNIAYWQIQPAPILSKVLTSGAWGFGTPVRAEPF